LLLKAFSYVIDGIITSTVSTCAAEGVDEDCFGTFQQVINGALDHDYFMHIVQKCIEDAT